MKKLFVLFGTVVAFTCFLVATSTNATMMNMPFAEEALAAVNGTISADQNKVAEYGMASQPTDVGITAQNVTIDNSFGKGALTVDIGGGNNQVLKTCSQAAVDEIMNILCIVSDKNGGDSVFLVISVLLTDGTDEPMGGVGHAFLASALHNGGVYSEVGPHSSA